MKFVNNHNRIVRRSRKTFLTLAWLVGATLISSAQKLPQHLFSKIEHRAMERWADSVYNSLSVEERLSQLIMPIVYPSGDAARIASEERRVRSHKWGGILYQKGLLAEQLKMNQRLQSASKTPMLIALDGEWGLYMRLKDAPRYPRNLGLGLNEEDRALYSYGREVARQCRLMGIHINFAPTVDVNINPLNPVIGSRSLGSDPNKVAKMSVAYALGLEDGGILSVAKHFPGHGDTSEDSHKTLPLVSADRKRLEGVELVPFRAYFKEGLGGVMTAHLRIPALDTSGVPSSLSRKITTNLLQEKMGFGGLIFTDGLEMKGVHTGSKGDVGVSALKAGNDILLGPANAEQQLSRLTKALASGELSESEIRHKVMKVLYYKYRLIVCEPQLNVSPEEVKSKIWTKAASQEMQTLWTRSLYYLSRNTQTEEQLSQGKYKRIAVVQYGNNPVSNISRPRSTASGGHIDYLSWEALPAKLESYDYILVNAFDSSIPSVVLQRFAKNKPLSLVYYATPFKVARAKWHQELSSVILTMEAAREAQEAVLALIAGVVPNKTPQNIRTLELDNTSDDPTASMTPKPQEPKHISFAPRGMRQIDGQRLAHSVDAIVAEALQKGAFPGCQIYVMQHGKEVLNKSYGSLEGAPSRSVSRSTIYDVASITKALVTTPAIMLLTSEGKLRLDAQVESYLPQLKDTNVGAITLRNLLLHQSGLLPGLPFAKELMLPMLDKDSIPYLSTKMDSRYRLRFGGTTFVRYDYRDVMLEMIARSGVRKPGQYVYSDLNFILLGLIVEKVTGKTLEQYIQDKLWLPMGLKLYFNPREAGVPLENVAPSQRYDELRGEKIRATVDDESAACLGGIAGNAGLFASAEELAKMAQLILNAGRWRDKQLIPKATVEQFLAARGLGGIRTLGFIRPQWGKRGNQAAESASQSAIGHYGFTGTAVWIEPKGDFVFVFLSNRTYTGRNNNILSRERYRPRLHQAIYDAMD